MTAPINDPSQTPPPPPSYPRAVRIPPDLHHSAALRLVPADSPDRHDAARRLVAGARAAGIDLGSVFGVIEPPSESRPAWVRQTVLAVVGAGRTAMIFQGSARGDESPRDHTERVACLEAAAEALFAQTERGPDARQRPAVCVLQSLPEPHEHQAVAALNDAGYIHVGDLAYMRRELARSQSLEPLKLPDGYTLRSPSTIAPGTPDHEALIRALEASYIDTLDCPELCGIRDSEDVLDSHAATGQFDPALWFLLFEGEVPRGCALFNAVPETKSSELVYLGLAPEARGLGLGRQLLTHGIERIAVSTSASDMLCAVDQRNEPAQRLYKALGFRSFSERRAFVRPLCTS